MIIDTIGTKLVDTLNQHPVLGVGSSIVTAIMSSQAIFECIGIVLALAIAVITLIIKLMDLIEKIKLKKAKPVRKKRLRIGPDDDEE